MVWNELTPENGLTIVPEGFGHAFITDANTTAVYVVSEIYSPKDESGLRYDDPSLSIIGQLNQLLFPKDLLGDY